MNKMWDAYEEARIRLMPLMEGEPSGPLIFEAGWNAAIEQQAERIKELEAKCDYWRDHYKDLRQRIDDAPVVAWMLEQEGCSHKKLTWLPAVLDFCHSVPLISKEDLQK